MVLCYGADYRIEIDQGAAYVDIAGRRLATEDGILIVESDRCVLRALGFPRSDIRGAVYVDLKAGVLADAPQNGAVFAKWSLLIPMGKDRFQTLVSYPLTPRN